MSTKKEKLLESAQKFIAKGQFDKAIKEYEQIVALDPGDIRLRQRLAEILVRVNRKQDAIREFEAIGQEYANHQYYLKAIAVYKQIQKLDPGSVKTTVILAGLNVKQGLIGNALSEFNSALTSCLKDDNYADAFKILESMLAADPDNFNTLLKSAETYYAADLQDKAFEKFSDLGLLLLQKGNQQAFGKICERIVELFPDRGEFPLELASNRLESGDSNAALLVLQQYIKKSPNSLPAWELLLETFRRRGDNDRLNQALQHMIRLFPDNILPKKRAIQYVLDACEVSRGIELLQLYGDDFHVKGETAALQEFYLRFLDLVPDNVDLLEGLQAFYAAVGNEACRADVARRLESLATPAEPGDFAFSAEPEMPVEVTETTSTEGLVEVSEEPLIPEWEEEIYVEFPDVETVAEETEEPTSIEMPGMELYEAPPTAVESTEWGELELSDFTQPGGEEISVAAEDFGIVPGEIGEIELDIKPSVDVSDVGGQVELEINFGEQGLDWLTPEEELSEPLYVEALPEEGLEESFSSVAEEEPPMVAEEAVGKPSGSGEGFWDLGSALSDDLERHDSGSGAIRSAYSPDSVFPQNSVGVQQLEESDTETHYNLGIAYKEMGLYDDAIAEFKVAAQDPRRHIDCLTLQGICYRDKGGTARAEDIFMNALTLKGVTKEERLSLNYELALLYENIGCMEDSIRLYREVRQEQADFRDVGDKLRSLLSEDAEPEVYELDLLEGDESKNR